MSGPDCQLYLHKVIKCQAVIRRYLDIRLKVVPALLRQQQELFDAEVEGLEIWEEQARSEMEEIEQTALVGIQDEIAVALELIRVKKRAEQKFENDIARLQCVEHLGRLKLQSEELSDRHFLENEVHIPSHRRNKNKLLGRWWEQRALFEYCDPLNRSGGSLSSSICVRNYSSFSFSSGNLLRHIVDAKKELVAERQKNTTTTNNNKSDTTQQQNTTNGTSFASPPPLLSSSTHITTTNNIKALNTSGSSSSSSGGGGTGVVEQTTNTNTSSQHRMLSNNQQRHKGLNGVGSVTSATGFLFGVATTSLDDLEHEVNNTAGEGGGVGGLSSNMPAATNVMNDTFMNMRHKGKAPQKLQAKPPTNNAW
eukprot:TRINITY_DN57769_c1_g1_i2.p1 TRINITY_DN57769_c1_g1~~TRINITY_DN57769_c1_g1_i2.p1  ORF type:complete len:377 (-),score=89.25 TRINITY_DN57769_c1_g1_i2:81-1178(-)